jgi:hypothetical protein
MPSQVRLATMVVINAASLSACRHGARDLNHLHSPAFSRPAGKLAARFNWGVPPHERSALPAELGRRLQGFPGLPTPGADFGDFRRRHHPFSCQHGTYLGTAIFEVSVTSRGRDEIKHPRGGCATTAELRARFLQATRPRHSAGRSTTRRGKETIMDKLLTAAGIDVSANLQSKPGSTTSRPTTAGEP